MEKVKIIDKKTGAVKEVKKSLASDYIGTGKFEMYVEKKQTEKPKFTINKEDKFCHLSSGLCKTPL